MPISQGVDGTGVSESFTLNSIVRSFIVTASFELGAANIIEALFWKFSMMGYHIYAGQNRPQEEVNLESYEGTQSKHLNTFSDADSLPLHLAGDDARI